MTAYIIKSSVSLLLMFGLYWFLLRQVKLFKFNRVFLIFSILFSLSIPLVSIPISFQNNKPQGNILTSFNRVIPSYSFEQNTSSNSTYQELNETNPFPAPVSERINYSQILILLYLLGVLLLLVRFIRNIYFIYRQMRISEKISYSGQKLVLMNNQINPFCFFNTIFVSKRDYLNTDISEVLLSHEIEHIRQSHSIDVIFIELIKIIYWFNPILILYSRAIRVNHEYLADNGVTQGSSDIKDYADKLLNYISCKQNVSLTSGFNPTLTRKRLIMLTKSRSGWINYGARIFVTFNLAASLLMVMSFKPSYSQQEKDTVKHQQVSGVPQELHKLNSETQVIDKGKKTNSGLNTIESKPAKAELQINEDGVAAASNMNVLYLGISNPIEIAVPGVTSDKVTATITNGTITRTTTGWEVKPSSLNDLVLIILVNNIKVNEKKFRVKSIPSPVPVFAGINNGSASKDILLTGSLEAELKDFLWDLKFEIESFTFAFSKDGFDREITSKGNKLTDEMKSIISDLKPGQYIIFKDIKAIGPDGKLKDLNQLILKLN